MTYVVVFVAYEDPVEEGGEAREVWEPCGTVTVPLRTQRRTILERVLEGQVDGDAVGNGIPQIPIDAGESGELLLIPEAELGDRVPVRARRKFVIEVAGQQALAVGEA